MGVASRLTPSRKNGRFSGNSKAKRSLAEICAVSDSICEKSGLSVTSTALSASGVHFTSSPPRACGDWFTSGEQGIRSADEAIAAARQPCGKELIAKIARVIPVQHDAPRLRIDVVIPQRRK